MVQRTSRRPDGARRRRARGRAARRVWRLSLPRAAQTAARLSSRAACSLTRSSASAAASASTRAKRAPASAPSSMSYSLSQLDAIGDVDPVAEADVYLAYGRDLQAEEILKEAMRASPEPRAWRSAPSCWRSTPSGATPRASNCWPAVQLFGLTQGQGEDWPARSQELGQQIDPETRCTSRAPARSGGERWRTWLNRWARARCPAVGIAVAVRSSSAWRRRLP